MFTNIFFTIILVFLLSGFFTIFGFGLLNIAFKNFQRWPFSMRIGSGYFFGVAGFLSLWRTLSLVLGSAKLPYFVSLILIAILIFFGLQKKLFTFSWLKEISPRAALKFFGLMFFIWIFQLALWLQVLPVPNDPFDNFGSAHPVRYTNIAEYIFTQDKIPVLNQNFAQTLLAVSPRFLGEGLPFLSLNLWLGISIFALTITIYGLFKYLGFGSHNSKWAAFLFMLSNTALSFTHVLSLDSNNPFLMSSYIDATCGIGTFFILLLLVYSIHKSDNGKLSTWFFVPVILAAYWNISGGQNIVLAGLLLFILSIYYIIKQRNIKHGIFVLTFVLGIFSVLGTTLGGMLTPKSFRDKVSIPGLASINRQGEYTGIKPELPFAYGFSRDWQYGNPYDPAEKQMYVQILRGGSNFISGEIIHKIVWRLESNLWLGLRIIFFPLLGLVWFCFIKNKPDINLQENLDVKKLWQYAVIIFVIGFIFSFSVIIGGRKWEMSRFMILPYALGLIFFIYSLNYFVEKIKNKLNARRVIFVISFIMTVGPIINSGAIIHRNFKNLDYAKKKLEFFASYPGTLGTDLWKSWIEKGLVKE